MYKRQGKTYAYLVAGIVFSRSRAARGLANQPVLISTSSIALQNAVLEEYLPFLSSVLIEDRMTKTPIRADVYKRQPIETVCGRYGGGVRMADWYQQGRRRLTPRQTALLRRLAAGLEGEDLEDMKQILKQFVS